MSGLTPLAEALAQILEGAEAVAATEQRPLMDALGAVLAVDET